MFRWQWCGSGYGICFDKKEGGEGGGGAGGAGGNGGEGGSGNQPNYEQQFKEMQSMNAKLLERLEKLEKAGSKPGDESNDDNDLARKAKLKREQEESEAARTKSIEAAVTFNTGLAGWYKTNASLLPKSIEGILAQAEKETYDTQADKAAAIKVGIVSEFFAQKENDELLTPGLKKQIEEFSKLTKTVKQERAGQIFEQVFEPAFETLKRVKKAELKREGLGDPSDRQSAYFDKMHKHSASRYLKKGSQ